MGDWLEVDLGNAEMHEHGVEEGCGCVWCDLGFQPVRDSSDSHVIYHNLARGDQPCTNPNPPVQPEF